LIVGASVRAAAFSALRAGLQPWCADLFADVDLQAVCPVRRIDRDDYPEGLAALMSAAPQAPWFYTGALENRPALVGQLSEMRPLWGNGPAVLHRVRQPQTLHAALSSADLPCATTWHAPAAPRTGKWLAKPLASAGGRNIRVWDCHRGLPPPGYYLQQFVDGWPCAAIYVGNGPTATLLGVTRQLIGERWLHARRFQYCGSIGPLGLSTQTRELFQRIGATCARTFRLRGIFGVDCIMSGGLPCVVEINPRYTASVEILEHALGIGALEWHRRGATGEQSISGADLPQTSSTFVAKGILFAHESLSFPQDGPWLQALELAPTVLRPFADIPRPGTPIGKGQPILTVFSRADSEAACEEALRNEVKQLDLLL
jgi:predicted ATP-grasp superfamily ATP-dependent carboligase